MSRKNPCRDCTSDDNDKVVRVVDNSFVVAQGADLLFETESLNLGSFFQRIESYHYGTYSIPYGERLIFDMNDNNFEFLHIRVSWPEDVKLGEKMLELFLPSPRVSKNMTIPAFHSDEEVFVKLPLKDIFALNTVRDMSEFRVINVGGGEAKLHVLAAK